MWLRLTIAVAVWGGMAWGQPGCTVIEDQKIATVSGRFSAGTSAVTVTLPNRLYPSEPTFLYLETAGGGFEGMRLESGGDRTGVRDGAALRLHPKRNERLSISLTLADGRRCEWVPKVGTAKGEPWHEVDGFRERGLLFRPNVFHGGFRNAGDPILVQVGGALADQSAVFSIDGEPATVLSRNGPQVVLRDPHPAAGVRAVACRGYSINLPMIVLEFRAPETVGHGELEIRVSGRERVGFPTLPRALLMLYNFDPGRVKVRCGRPLNYGDPRIVPLEAKGGELAASCRVEVMKPGPLVLDGSFSERGARAR
jgi:hypothetical protein